MHYQSYDRRSVCLKESEIDIECHQEHFCECLFNVMHFYVSRTFLSNSFDFVLIKDFA